MNRRASQVVAALAAAGFTAALASAAHAGPEFTRAAAGRYALVGGTVHTVTKGDVENGTVLVDGGRITAVGTGLAVPADATVIDCKGKQVYPGFIAANTQLGLIEIETIEGANDTQETGNINPNIRAEVMFNPDSDLLPVTRLNGVTSALVVPGGGAIHGTSALMHLDGWTAEDMTVRAPVGLHVDWPGAQSVRQFGPGPSAPDADALKAQAAAVQAIRDAFGDARAYEKARAAEAAKGSPRHDADARWDAMRKAVSGEVPVFFHANSARQIRGVLDFVDEQGLAGAVLVGGGDAWRFADDLKARGMAVIVGGTLVLPARRYEPYDEGFTLPARLAAAGVRFCISDGGGSGGAANARNLPFHAGMAAAFGLARDEALKSVTIYPAQILGVGDRLGSIEAGKVADLQVTDGDPLEDATHCERVFIGGRPIPMESRQTRLFQKYDSRPRGAHARPR